MDSVFREIANAETTITGDAVGRVVGIGKMAVNKQVKKLIARGIPIEISSRGYIYRCGDSMDEITLSYKLERAGLEHINAVVEVVDSTNNKAKAIAKGNTGGFLVMTPHQTDGKGRNKRKFYSEVGGLYMTYSVPTDDLIVTDSLNIVLMSGLAVSNVLEKYNITSQIKWPNDVYVGGKKICGILLESNLTQSVIERVYIGIGVNVSNNLCTEIADKSTSMHLQGALKACREDVAIEIISEINRLMKNYLIGGQESFKQHYLAKSWTIGRNVYATVGNEEIEGLATDITELGYLKVLHMGNEYLVIAGDVM